jgi:ABC-type Zn2+ transport system substrate-binding protein/surface adhesin
MRRRIRRLQGHQEIEKDDLADDDDDDDDDGDDDDDQEADDDDDDVDDDNGDKNAQTLLAVFGSRRKFASPITANLNNISKSTNKWLSKIGSNFSAMKSCTFGATESLLQKETKPCFLKRVQRGRSKNSIHLLI